MALDRAQKCVRRAQALAKRGHARFGTYKKLKEKTDIPAATLYRLATGKHVPSIVLIDRLARSLGETFYLGDYGE